MQHDLKCNTRFYNDVASLKKKFEVRKDDRKYCVEDVLNILDYSSLNGFSGRSTMFRVTYKLTHLDYPEGVKKGYCILGIEPLDLGF